MSSIGAFPSDWSEAIGPAASALALSNLDAAVATERAVGDVFPPAQDVFAALRLTPYRSVRAIILGQDPYHGPGEAHGLAFSVRPGVRIPPSLRNVFEELRADLGVPLPTSGSLVPWAENGVLLLNSILTVAKGQPASHRQLGWRPLTKAAVDAVQELDHPVAFLLWGAFAQKMAGPIDESRHAVVRTSHPSPLSRREFLGTRPFSDANAKLVGLGAPPIDWSLP